MPPDSELPGNPGRSLAAYKELMERCWHRDADARPMFESTVIAIDALLAAEPVRRTAAHMHGIACAADRAQQRLEGLQQIDPYCPLLATVQGSQRGAACTFLHWCPHSSRAVAGQQLADSRMAIYQHTYWLLAGYCLLIGVACCIWLCCKVEAAPQHCSVCFSSS